MKWCMCIATIFVCVVVIVILWCCAMLGLTYPCGLPFFTLIIKYFSVMKFMLHKHILKNNDIMK